MSSSSMVKSQKLAKTPVVKFVTELAFKNKRFDMEVTSDFQLFIVDDLGELYTVLTNNFPSKSFG